MSNDHGFSQACPTGNHWTNCKGAGAPDTIDHEEEKLACPECGVTLDQDEALHMDDLYFCDDQCWGSWRAAAAEWRGEIDR